MEQKLSSKLLVVLFLISLAICYGRDVSPIIIRYLFKKDFEVYGYLYSKEKKCSGEINDQDVALVCQKQYEIDLTKMRSRFENIEAIGLGSFLGYLEVSCTGKSTKDKLILFRPFVYDPIKALGSYEVIPYKSIETCQNSLTLSIYIRKGQIRNGYIDSPVIFGKMYSVLQIQSVIEFFRRGFLIAIAAILIFVWIFNRQVIRYGHDQKLNSNQSNSLIALGVFFLLTSSEINAFLSLLIFSGPFIIRMQGALITYAMLMPIIGLLVRKLLAQVNLCQFNFINSSGVQTRSYLTLMLTGMYFLLFTILPWHALYQVKIFIPIFYFFYFLHTRNLFYLFVTFLSALDMSKIFLVPFFPMSLISPIFLGLCHIQYFSYKLSDLKHIVENSVFTRLAQQIAHDIRSPLTALDVGLGDMQQVPEENRVLARNALQRIRDISNQLLQKNISSESIDIHGQHNQTFGSSEISQQLIFPIIETIVSEKRVQYRTRLNLRIETQFIFSDLGLFSKINSIELKRIISNLINNSVEAINSNQGLIEVILLHEDNYAVIKISDNGPGIPKKILDSFGDIGISYGKEGTESGSGLGIYHAKKTIESWNGQFVVQSTQGSGTSIKMLLPICEHPAWFINELYVNKMDNIIILDDEPSIHQIWNNRFIALNLNNKIYHPMSPGAFRTVVSANQLTKNNTVVLSDFEFINIKENGLDLLKEFNSKTSILVTSRFEDEEIRAECENNNIKLLPKPIVSYIPIKIKSDS